MHVHRRARLGGYGAMIQKIANTHVVHEKELKLNLFHRPGQFPIFF